MDMKVKIVKIGNSKGIRIPKVLLRQTGIDDEVNLEVEDDQIILRPFKKSVRKGWNSSFRKMAELEDDKLVDEENLSNPTAFEDDEWEW
jgi:antitoxin MazE